MPIPVEKEKDGIVRVTFRILRWICPSEYYEAIEGDLLQWLQRDRQRFGSKVARQRLVRNAFLFFRPGILLRNNFSIPVIQNVMIRNYFIIAIRNFQRQKVYTLLNVLGLSLGVAASLLIMQYVKYERSFDRFHWRAEDIYRIQYNRWQDGELNFESAVSVPAVGPALKNNFPEVQGFTRFLPTGAVLAYYGEEKEPVTFREENMLFADTTLFELFDFSLLHGDVQSCLKGINKVILSESTARKYFGDADPVGKKLSANGDERIFDVTGVFRNIPENSHIKFDILVSYETINAMTENESETSWGWYDFYTFVMLAPHTDLESFQAKWNAYLAAARKADWEKGGATQEFILRPLTDIHLYSHLLYETSPEELRDGDAVSGLQVTALFLLVIAWVNYINLATARSFNRANEVGVRKVMGAQREQLLGQFLIESVVINVGACILALGLVRILWPWFSQLTGWNIPLSYLLQQDFWLMVLWLFLTGAVLSGLYPAIVLSSFKPVSVLKGKFMGSSAGNYIRKALVICQFTASMVLISGSLIVYQQLTFMKNTDLGVDLGETLVAKGPVVTDSLYEQQFEAFKNEVLRIPGVTGVTASSNIPGEENYWTRNIARVNGGEGDRLITTHVAMDEEHVRQYGIDVVAGRSFDRAFPSDKFAVLLNESLSEALGFKTPDEAIGQKVAMWRDTLEIIGVLADFHQLSLKTKVIPVVFRLMPSSSFYSIKLNTKDYQWVVSALQTPWTTFFPGNPLDYFFLDQFYNRQYIRDHRFGEVFTLFTFLAIFIASLGLLGLASYMALQRTREIGIRKVLGSSVPAVILLLSRGFMQPVLLAVLLAIPAGWWLMTKWLETFPYHIELVFWPFLAAGILIVVVAFVSVASQTLRAALTKPAETLKYE
jgi:putative ABC transport system permease protein